MTLVIGIPRFPKKIRKTQTNIFSKCLFRHGVLRVFVSFCVLVFVTLHCKLLMVYIGRTRNIIKQLLEKVVLIKGGHLSVTEKVL